MKNESHGQVTKRKPPTPFWDCRNGQEKAMGTTLDQNELKSQSTTTKKKKTHRTTVKDKACKGENPESCKAKTIYRKQFTRDIGEVFRNTAKKKKKSKKEKGGPRTKTYEERQGGSNKSK